MNIVNLEFPKCCECGVRATKKLELVEFDERGVVGPADPKHYCDAHFPQPLDDIQLRLLVDRRDATISDIAQTMADAIAVLRDTDVQSVADRIENAILTLNLAIRDLRVELPHVALPSTDKTSLT